MSSSKISLAQLSPEEKRALLKRALLKRGETGTAVPSPVRAVGEAAAQVAQEQIPESHYRIEKLPQYCQGHLQRAFAERTGIRNPFFHMHESIARDTTMVEGRSLINFAGYNYLGLNGDPRIILAAQQAAEQYGTSASGSRVISGEKPPHRTLELALAALHGVADAVAFVSGHATNVSTIACLMGPKDLILHDRLVHNSVVQGAMLSGAARQAFPHNDWQAVEVLLTRSRRQFEKVLIVVEGIYGMDGDICPLDRLIDIRRRHKALLMVDEAHSIGALGRAGRGVGEQFGVPSSDVDVWMGTLSKTFAACGGYIAGSAALIELLKYAAAGFVYSVGMPPPIAAAANAAIEVMLAEPQRVDRLRENGRIFLDLAKRHGLDTGRSAGINVIPVMVGRSVTAARLANALFDRGICVSPIIYPAVEERAARLRFFITSLHDEDQIRAAVVATSEELARLNAEIASDART